MREGNPIAELQRRLIELGCPEKVVRKIVRETAEHLRDLQKAAVGSGVTPEEAAARAAEQLGDPGELAERHVEEFKQSTWLGRRSAPFSLIILPVVFWCLLCGVSEAGTNMAFSRNWDAFDGLDYLTGPLVSEITGLFFVVFGLVFFHSLQRNAGLRLKSRLIAVGVITLAAWCPYVQVAIALVFGMGPTPHRWNHLTPTWASTRLALIPLLTGLLIYLGHLRVVAKAGAKARIVAVPNLIKTLRRGLVTRGCPAAMVRRIVRETAEHLEDLKAAAVAHGLSPEAAGVQAAAQLGEPEALAERHVEACRATSTWGRLPVFYFGLLPILVSTLLALIYMSLNGGWMPQFVVSGLLALNKPWIFFNLSLVTIIVVAGGFALVTHIFCRRAKKLALGRRTVWLTGGVMAAQGLVLHVAPSKEQGMAMQHTFSVREGISEYNAHMHPTYSPAQLEESFPVSDQSVPKPTEQEKQQWRVHASKLVTHDELLASDYPLRSSPNWKALGIGMGNSESETNIKFGPDSPGAEIQKYEWAQITETHGYVLPMPLVSYAWPTPEGFSNLSIWLNVGGPMLVAWWMARGLRREEISVEDGDDWTAAVA